MHFVLCIIAIYYYFYGPLYILFCFSVFLHVYVHLYQEQNFESNMQLQVIGIVFNPENVTTLVRTLNNTFTHFSKASFFLIIM